MTNEALTAFVDTSDEWIKTRTGIQARHISQGETTTDLAIAASQEALEKAQIAPEAIDLIIVATITPDCIMPSTACCVQEAIGATHATAFDITAACSGFLYASKIAVEAIRAGSAKHVLVVGAEVLSKVLDWEDRSTCVLFGDGAGAVVYSEHAENKILKIYTESNGSAGKALTLEGRPLRNCLVEQEIRPTYMAMDGQSVYRFATTVVPMSIERVLEDTGYTTQQVDCFVLHQANERIMDSVAKKLNVPNEKFFKNLQRYGNTSGASIPIALYDVSPQLKPGDKVVLCGFGGGLTWGSILLQWT